MKNVKNFPGFDNFKLPNTENLICIVRGLKLFLEFAFSKMTSFRE
jgi:hypothetical protein